MNGRAEREAVPQRPQMTKVEYKMIQDRLLFLGTLLENLDLDGFIEMGEMAQTVGPFIDPTLWMKGTDNLSMVLELARASKVLQECFKRSSRQ